MIEAIDLCKTYEDGVVALDALNLQVKAGEIYCLLGANGAGKTTALHIFMDFLEPTSGQARLNGIDVHEQPLAAKKQVAYLSENVRLYEVFTARQNLEFFARLSGKSGLDPAEYDRIMSQAGLPERAFDQRVRSFSKGMHQKLGIAICMLKDTPCLLLDEPMSGLDPKASADFVAVLNALRNRGKAILISTHDIFRAKELADQIGILKDGAKVMERTREELQDENLEGLYLDYMRERPEHSHVSEQTVGGGIR